MPPIVLKYNLTYCEVKNFSYKTYLHFFWNSWKHWCTNFKSKKENLFLHVFEFYLNWTNISWILPPISILFLMLRKVECLNERNCGLLFCVLLFKRAWRRQKGIRKSLWFFLLSVPFSRFRVFLCCCWCCVCIGKGILWLRMMLSSRMGWKLNRGRGATTLSLGVKLIFSFLHFLCAARQNQAT